MTEPEYRDVSELPQWIQMLLDEQWEKAYNEGWETGRKNLWYSIERSLKTARPSGA